MGDPKDTNSMTDGNYVTQSGWFLDYVYFANKFLVAKPEKKRAQIKG
jgi:hypothetical protein